MTKPSSPKVFSLLQSPTRFLFFTGKGGVGKTSVSAATAIHLADAGKNVLLVSTDAASNLDQMLGIELRNSPVPVPGVPTLSVLNIDPDNAAESYRERVLAQMQGSSEEDISTVREQLSGACTTEIAAFDEFSSLLSDGFQSYDHVIFDTAPTGHTLRLLSLPKAWTGFLRDNNRGASCLGPHSGLKMQESRFQAALKSLSDHAQTTVILVARPERSAIEEAAKTSEDLKSLGLSNQRLVVNAVFRASDPKDEIAVSLERVGAEALSSMPSSLAVLPRDSVPLRPFDTVGSASLRNLLLDIPAVGAPTRSSSLSSATKKFASLAELVATLANKERGLIMVMGKGGVGKTTIAASLAVGLVKQGKSVHLSTTDPAAHLAMTLEGELVGLKVDRIDPKAETQNYIDKIMATKGAKLTQAERDLMLEDLQSPCTEEVAVFHAFSRIVAEARSSFVVLDTAPTGHSLLLMDATGAYHRQMVRQMKNKVTTPLMRLQDPTYTQIILVTLPETTPVTQAAELQDDLRRANVEPFAWVMNKSVLYTGTSDPVLASRLDGERRQIERIEAGLAKRLFIVPWLTRPPVGVEALSMLASSR
jgi:arsenite-transporting ATPase